ncbi:acyl carrier protein [Rhizobium sp. RM]|uniref:acyl carrier protein n=1 Tax=Rhizobium/Agrobacterium group TaxID=227290 RepID=UPI00110DCC56|nr:MULTISPECIES: acyl carrier protein [Rhizobium/Agrobacterium group]NWJ27334.1 acyl carrier protein [Rhizobium sp. RM]TMV20389.1 acyl carrier protein [Rhizobium sp. Td3]UXS03482.1 acyl carrier protein [Agrobacterium tumefaciens]
MNVPNQIEPANYDVAARVTQIIVEQLGVDADKVTNEASFSDDLNADSLEVVQIVMEIEEAFNLEIPDKAADKIITVGDAIRFIETAKG